MLGSSPIIAFASTTDSKRAVAFYRDILGLRLVSEDPFAAVFDANGTMFRVASAPKVKPAPYTILGWQVAHINKVIDGLRKRGVEFNRYDSMPQDDRGAWKSPSGAKIAWFQDPDGNVLSLTEF